MAQSSEISVIAILERTRFGPAQCIWSYPIIDDVTEQVLIARAPAEQMFIFSKFQSNWQYIYTFHAKRKASQNIETFTICIISQVFNPEKFDALSQIIGARYYESEDPVNVLEIYLNIFMNGEMPKDKANLWASDNFPNQRAMIANCSIKEAVNLFGIESVLIWNALLLKKRIFVVSDSMTPLLRFMRVLPHFVWHRGDWTILRPFVSLNPLDLRDLESAGVYCAGFVDPTVRNHENLYDLFVDIQSRSIIIAEHAKDDFRMGQLHKEVALLMTSSAQDESKQDQDIIRELTSKTKDIISKVNTLCAQDPSGRKKLTNEILEQNNVPVSLRKFLLNLAQAENSISSL